MTITLQRRTLQPGEQVLQSMDDDDLEEGEDMDEEESAQTSRTTGKKRRLTNNTLLETHRPVQGEKPQQRLAWEQQDDPDSFGILIQIGNILRRLVSQSRFDRYTGAWSLAVVRDLWLR